MRKRKNKTDPIPSLDETSPYTIDWAAVRDEVIVKERIEPRSPEKKAVMRELLQSLDNCLLLAKSLSKPKVVFTRKEVLGITDDAVRLEGGLSIPGASLTGHIKGSEIVYLFVVTIGEALESFATGLMNSGDHLSGYLLDRIGSFAVESLAAQFEDRLRRAYRLCQMSVSMRYSPGYCDWPIEEQSALNKALDFSRAGVRLTEGGMMVPKKSISGLVGVGPKGAFSTRRSHCLNCSMKDSCTYRRVPAASLR